MGRVGGIGEGTLALIVIWSIVAFIAVLARGTAKPKLIATVATAIAALVTLILLLIPRSEEGSQPIRLDPDRVDVNVIPRWTAFTFLTLATVLAAVLGIAVEWTTPVRAIKDPARW
eukprot:m.23471 g.23471  ORF g.23471 m.23471 type:complete len:116 (+) comp11387_c0_seq1:26-373(+)